MATKTATRSKAAGDRRKSALIVWGGWEGHTPKACADVFAPWLKSKGFRVVVSDTLDAQRPADQLQAATLSAVVHRHRVGSCIDGWVVQ